MSLFDEMIKGVGQLWDNTQRRAGLEERFGLALPTHDAATGWSGAHLDILESGLARLPADHVAPLGSMTLGGTTAWGSHLHDDIWLTSGAAGLGASEKHPGDTSALAGHDHPVRQLAMTVDHEVGHEVQEHHADAAARIFAAAGWRSELSAADAGLDREEMMAILSERGGELERDGVRYQLDTKGMGREAGRRHERGERTDAIPPMFLAYEEDFVPMEGAHNGDSDVDSWAYGRSDPNEYFAEMYTKAANLPELLYQDLVGEPEAMVEAAHLGGDPMAARLAEAAEHKRAQWDVMRQEVFGVTDALVEDRVADLEALHGWADDGATRELTQAFREDAQRVATPDQLERLLDSYLRAGS